jgi:hypothetical protein
MTAYLTTAQTSKDPSPLALQTFEVAAYCHCLLLTSLKQQQPVSILLHKNKKQQRKSP